MTYSVSASGTTKAEALSQAAEQFERIRKDWPAHAADSAAVQDLVGDLVGMLAEPFDTVSISVSGSLNVGHPEGQITGASASVNVYANKRAQ